MQGLKFFLETNIQLCDATQLRGIVKRVNDRPMLGKQKAVTGETEVPVAVLESIMHGANGEIPCQFLPVFYKRYSKQYTSWLYI